MIDTYSHDYSQICKYGKNIDWDEVAPWNRYEIYYVAMMYYDSIGNYDMAGWSLKQLCKSRPEPIEPEDDMNYFDGGDLIYG